VGIMPEREEGNHPFGVGWETYRFK
jgi:hypothetical protein